VRLDGVSVKLSPEQPSAQLVGKVTTSCQAQDALPVTPARNLGD
jgi:hypothetical protein